jgi:hypothetical protein
MTNPKWFFSRFEEAGSLTVLLLIAGVLLRLFGVESTGQVWFVFTYVFLLSLASTAILFVICVCWSLWKSRQRG